MKSPNYAIRKQYKTLLENNIVAVDAAGSRPINVFYQYAPQQGFKEYIVMTLPIHNEIGTIGETNTSRISVQLKICTKEKEFNSGRLADDLAGQVLELIYPNKQTQIDLTSDGFTCSGTRLVSDIISNYQNDANMVYIDRIITFEHIIYHN
jgi:hypothetical protein